MDWNKGYSVRYYIKLVDAATWRDTDTYDIVDGSVSRSDGELQETADLEMKAVLDDSCTAISGGALSQKHAAKSHLETQNTETEDNKCLLF